MDAWKAKGADAFEKLTPENWENHGLPERIPSSAAIARADYSIEKSREGMEAYLKDSFGEEDVFGFTDRDFPGFRHDVLINAGTLARHVDPERAPYLPLLKESIEDPSEIWLSFEKHRGTGKVFLRERFIKVIEMEKDRALLMVTQARGGVMEAWTVVPTADMKYINRQRFGRLIWKGY
jgi:hypothetical protein